MIEKLLIILMFTMAWAVPSAYAAPPDQMATYATQTNSIAIAAPVQAVRMTKQVAYRHTIDNFKSVPTVLIVPAGKHTPVYMVALVNQPDVVRGGHIGVIRSI